MDTKGATGKLRQLVRMLMKRLVPSHRIRTLLEGSNLNSTPWVNQTSRWPLEQIAVHVQKPNGDYPADHAYHQLVREAMEAINGKLGRPLLHSRGGPDIIVTFGTAYIPTHVKSNFQGYAANVSTGAGDGESIASDGAGAIQAPVRINIAHRDHRRRGGNACDCIVTVETVIHEFGHALGLDRHFPGFDGKTAISPQFWRVLAMLYANPAGTRFEALKTGRVT